MPGIAEEFPIDPEIVLLNHASFGVPTTHMLDVAAQTRRRIERDAAGLLAGSMREELLAELASAADFLAAPPESFALTMNATEASSAVASSMGRHRRLRVAMSDTEYPSVIRAWQVATAGHGGSVQLVHLDNPVDSPDEVLHEFERQVSGGLDVVVASLVTSSTALVLPVQRIGQWASERGAIMVVDAAHGPGHVDFGVTDFGASVVYGTLHKWLPVPRPLGFLHAVDELRDLLRPAMVAVHWDEGFADRFAWRGTWDPTPALCFSVALGQWRTWQASGLLVDAERMADLLSQRLTACDLEPTGARPLVAPRFRAFRVPGVTPESLRATLDAARIRAWVGAAPSGRTLLRVATHVYTSEEHVQRTVDAVSQAVRRRRGGSS
ncbi:MAG TPA: aminotransferase class V-fold PLP-dependent enzyme [Jatrophihabitans sp.]|nr:aminotransferase class V-fold PLP-dependent enzyme [Jatrophihabitans sp.]